MKETWTSTSRKQEKPWGSILTWSTISSLHGRVINIKRGMRTSLKYHCVKNETIYVVDGRVLVTRGNSKTLADPNKHPYVVDELRPGDVLVIQSECPYRIEAIEDSRLFEIGDRLNDEPVRLEDDFGRTTKEEKR